MNYSIFLNAGWLMCELHHEESSFARAYAEILNDLRPDVEKHLVLSEMSANISSIYTGN